MRADAKCRGRKGGDGAYLIEEGADSRYMVLRHGAEEWPGDVVDKNALRPAAHSVGPLCRPHPSLGTARLGLRRDGSPGKSSLVLEIGTVLAPFSPSLTRGLVSCITGASTYRDLVLDRTAEK